MAVTSKKSTKKKANPKTTNDTMRSFKLYPSEKPFFTFRINQQTFYWVIIGLLVLGLGTWTTFLTIKLQTIYDRVEEVNVISE
jgi:hypothetical protein